MLFPGMDSNLFVSVLYLILMICTRNAQTRSYTYYDSFAPDSVPTDATSINVRVGDVIIQPYAFVRNTECTSISFEPRYRYYITTLFIKENAWFGLNSLTYLSIQITTLAELTKDIFKHLGSLQTLILRENRIHTISDGAFYTLDSLTHLYLDQNLIVDVEPGVWSDISGLTHLSISYNSMQILKNKSLEYLSALKTLNVNSNGISSVETDAFYGLVYLEKLFLNSNNLSFANETETAVWRDLSLLKELYLKSNKIEVLKSNMFQGLLSLQKLDLSKNNIAIVNVNTFRELKNLTDLDISGNNISLIETGTFTGLRSLTILNLTQNEITFSKGLFRGLISVEDLDLTRENIIRITVGTFQGLSSLQRLIISHANLESVEPKSFQDMNSTLVHLDLSNNELTSLQEETFHCLLLLEDLLLHNNKISNIAPRAFTGLGSLKVLQLQQNQLETFEKISMTSGDCVFSSIRPLIRTALYLYENPPWRCDKRIQWIKDGRNEERLNPIMGVCSNLQDTDWEYIEFPPYSREICLSSGYFPCAISSNCSLTPGDENIECNCNNGTSLSGTACEPIHFCSRNSYSCSVCIDNKDSTTCVCNPGFRRNGTECVNINECKEGTNNCSLSEECIDREGYYICSCIEGYFSNGETCINVDECALTNACPTDATCIDTDGSYDCVCNTGFSGNGKICENIDECEGGQHNCSQYANCTDTVGSYDCVCDTGFSGDGYVCNNTNECELPYWYFYPYTPVRRCPSNSVCIDTFGSFDCQCNSGYVENGTLCEDINECESGEHNCSEHAICTDALGSYSCDCNPGFSGDGYVCNNTNECELSKYHFYPYTSVSRCPSNSVCIDTFGSFDCACNIGFTGNSTYCKNIDECYSGKHNCSQYANCTDTVGSYDCVCDTGFSGDGYVCNNTNECELPYWYFYPYTPVRRCPSNSVCIDTFGSFDCQCNSGYVENGTLCEDINECESGEQNCSEYANCTDTVGSYYCVCAAGFSGNGHVCNNTNECELSQYHFYPYTSVMRCPLNSKCIDTFGSFDCVCNSGFTGDRTLCKNIDECDIGDFSCSENAHCSDTVGSYSCVCDFGFAWDGSMCVETTDCNGQCPSNSQCINNTCICQPGFRKIQELDLCIDINECDTGLHDCSENAECVDTHGSFSCRCSFPFVGDGRICNSQAQCETHDDCHVYAECMNGICTCRAGFNGNGETCWDADECEDGTHECSKFATCKDSFGSYTCSCNTGFFGNGILCDSIIKCPAGSHLSDGGYCKQCRKSTYNDKNNNVLRTCKPCPDGWITEGPGKTSASQCILPTDCPPGNFLDGTTGECIECPDGTYQPRASQTWCIPCPLDNMATGGPGAILRSDCETKRERQVPVTLVLSGEDFIPALSDQNSTLFKEKSDSVERTFNSVLKGTRHFQGLSVKSFRNGSIVADLSSTILDHPYGESIFFARLHSLKLDNLFDGKTFFDNTPEPEVFKITNLEPNYGPESGGTPVTMKGRNLLLHGPFKIYIGSLECPLVILDENQIVCQTMNSSIVDKAQIVNVSWLNKDIEDEMTEYTFTYKPNPAISSIYPNVTVVNGGIQVTVTGQNLDSVAEPVMVVVVVVDDEVSTLYQACSEKSASIITCPVPDLTDVVQDVKQTRPTFRECDLPSKQYHNIPDQIQKQRSYGEAEVTIQFHLDGYESQETSKTKIVDPPYIDSRKDSEPFVPYPPCSDKFIHIKGENFLQYFSAHDYAVKVGDEECTDVRVENNLITCRPPQDKPDIYSEVQVILGCHAEIVFTLEYEGPFSCEPVPYLTAGCAASFLVALLVAKICYKRKQNWTKMKSAQLQAQVDRHMRYRQPWWSGPPIRSWYPGYLASSRFPQSRGYLVLSNGSSSDAYNYPNSQAGASHHNSASNSRPWDWRNDQLSRTTTPEQNRRHQRQPWRMERSPSNTQLFQNDWNQGINNREYYRRRDSRRYMYQTNIDARDVQHKKLRRWFSLGSNSFDY